MHGHRGRIGRFRGRSGTARLGGHRGNGRHIARFVRGHADVHALLESRQRTSLAVDHDLDVLGHRMGVLFAVSPGHHQFSVACRNEGSGMRKMIGLARLGAGRAYEQDSHCHRRHTQGYQRRPHDTLLFRKNT